jgi:hypothetical protein
MRPAHSFSYVVLTSFVTLFAWLCLAVMMFVFLLWCPMAWLWLKLAPRRSGHPTADPSSVSHTHSLLKQTGICILFFLLLSAALSAQETSKVIPFNDVPTKLPHMSAQDVVVQVWDRSLGGSLVYSEPHPQIKVDWQRRIDFVLGSGNANGLDPLDFPAGASRYIDVVDSSGNSILHTRLPLSAVAFALSPGPQGPPGPQGEPGPPGPPCRGTVAQVNSGFGLLGGPITTTGTLSLDTSVTNSLYSQLGVANTFYGNQSFNGALAVTATAPSSGNQNSAFSVSGKSGGFAPPNTLNVATYASGDGVLVTSGVSSGQALRVLCTAGIGTDCYGVWAEGTSYGGLFYGTTFGVVAKGSVAGNFLGDVSIQGTLTKSAGAFKIDHPLDPANKYLTHSFVESPDMMNIYNGTILLDRNGEAWVTLPNWFEALNRDFRYQLTAIAVPSPNLYVAAEVSGNRFKIAGGQPGAKVSWQVTGVRHDAYADANRLAIEEDKPVEDRGYYLHPEIHGQPAEKSIFVKHHPLKTRATATAPNQKPK